jgi:protein tyrosine/serine phosphatase
LFKQGANKYYRIVALLVAIIFITGAGVYHHKTRPRHFLAVKEGVLYRSASLKPDNLKKVLDDYNIKTVVSLSGYDDPKNIARQKEENRICSEKGVATISIPMFAAKPPSEKQITRWLNILRNPYRPPILVHCTYGVVRTGMMVAIYEMEVNGKSNQQAFSE